MSQTPQGGRISITARDSAGNPIASAGVSVYDQGATVNGAVSGTTPLTVTVDNVGSLLTSGSTVKIGIGTTSYTATVVNETTVTISGFAGTLALSDDDRLVNVGAVPPLYNDSQYNESKANPMTTDSNGLAEAWAIGLPYDIIISKSGVTSQLRQDVKVNAPDERFYLFPTTSAVTMKRFDAVRSGTWTAADTLLAVSIDTTDKFYVDAAGGIHATGASDISTGGLTVTGTVAVTGALTTTTSATIGSGLTVSAGAVALPAGSLATATLAANAVTVAAVVTTDATDNVFTTEEVLATSPSITITSPNVATLINFNGSIAMNGGTSVITLRLRRGGLAGTLMYTWRYEHNNAGAGDHTLPISLLYVSPAGEPSGAQTYSITGEETGAGTGTILGSAVANSTITVFQLKK